MLPARPLPSPPSPLSRRAGRGGGNPRLGCKVRSSVQPDSVSDAYHWLSDETHATLFTGHVALTITRRTLTSGPVRIQPVFAGRRSRPTQPLAGDELAV